MNRVETGIEHVVLNELRPYHDRRGWLAEFHRMDELDHSPSMAYLSMTLPGMSRGPHEHALQTDLFVFAGPGEFEVYLYDNRPESATHGRSWSGVLGASRPGALIVPPRVIHAYRCVSDVPGLIANLPDKLYKGPGRALPVDEVRHEDRDDSPFYEAFDRALFRSEE